MADSQETFGTKKVGYVEGKYGPFRCGTCEHFVPSVSGCVQPQVMADSQIGQQKGDMRYAKVEAQGCCNMWYPQDKS